MKLATWAAGVRVPSGDGAGEPWQVCAWQRRLLAAVENPAHQVIACSTARANGKTALAALIARAFLPGGPIFRPGKQVLVVSATHEQARLVLEDVASWRPSARTLDYLAKQGAPWQVANSKQVARARAGRAEVRAMSARPKSLHGIRPDLIICDELTQWTQAPEMWSALRTSLGKRRGTKLLAVGTRPIAGSSHPFDRLLNGGADLSLVYAATEADERGRRLGHRRTWRKANPSLDVLPSLEDTLRREWAEAQCDDGSMAAFRSLRLNMGTRDTAESLLVDAGVWEAATADAPREGSLVVGVDLGATAAMSAAAGYWIGSGRLDAVACFGSDPDLLRRGQADGVGDLYSRMHRRGELVLSHGRVSDVKVLLEEVWDRWGKPAALVCDRWREGELRDALQTLGMPRTALLVRGQGFKDGGQDVRDFRSAFLGGRVRPVESLLLASAMGEARTVRDPSGNEKLAKSSQGGRRTRARDDAAAAAILSVAVGERRRRRGGQRSGRRWAMVR